MNKEFVPYEIALALKELGFDEPCFVYWVFNNVEITFSTANNKSGWSMIGFKNNQMVKKAGLCTAPTFSQAFRWFREKYNLCGEVYTVNMGAIDYTFLIRDLYSEDVKYDNFEANTGGYSGTFTTYEEAELECLKKLIQIVNNFSKKVSE